MSDALTELQERHEALRLRREVARLERQLAWEEQAARRVELREGWGEPISPREPLVDAPAFGFDGFSSPASRPEDRRHGRNAPHFETEQELARIRGVARWLAATDETSIGVLENLTNYVVGTGFTYSVVERIPGAAPRGLLEAVQEAVERFQEENNWRRIEREAFVRSRRDGEVFLRLEHHGGRPRIRFVEPELIRKPDDPRFMSQYAGAYDLDWELGVATDLGDAERIHGYHVDWSGDGRDWEFVPAERMEHIRVNVDCGVKRGLSDFYAAAAEIEQAAKLARNTAEGAAIQATIAYIKEAASGTGRPEIEAQQTAHSDWTTYSKTPDGHRRSIRFEKFFPGRVITTAGMKYHAGPLGTSNAPTFIEVIQMVLRRVGQRWSMPEYMVSGDASNANYASTLVAESPFVKSAEAKQMWYAEAFRSLFWKALRLSRDRRDWPEDIDFAQVQRWFKLRLEAPRVSVRNRAEETSIRSTLHAAGILSRRTWAALEELDFDVEREHLAREQ